VGLEDRFWIQEQNYDVFVFDPPRNVKDVDNPEVYYLERRTGN
jgi:hypothetical protein